MPGRKSAAPAGRIAVASVLPLASPPAMKWRRVLTRSLLAGLALVAALAVATLRPVDPTPYPGQPYHAETRARLAELAAPVLTAAPLAAGFGGVSLLPAPGSGPADAAAGRFPELPLAGYGHRQGRPATGMREELTARALALRSGATTVVVAGIEALIVPPEVAALVASRLETKHRLPPGNLYLGATHTHAGPGGWGEGWLARQFAGTFTPGLREWLADRLVAAAEAALADLRPARLGHGRFSAPALVRNRLLGPLGRVDPEFSLLVVAQEGGRRGVVGAYAAHATALPGQGMEFAGDYPGAWRRAVEEATGGWALFLAGAMGSHGPVAPARGVDGADQMGRELARRTLEILPTLPLSPTAPLAVRSVAVTLPEAQVRVAQGLRLRAWAADRLLPWRAPVPLQVLRAGGVLWISTPGDFSGELALDVKDFARARGLDAAVTSFNGAYVGYILPGRHYALPGYEPRTMSFYGPQFPDYLMELIRELAAPLAPAP